MSENDVPHAFINKISNACRRSDPLTVGDEATLRKLCNSVHSYRAKEDIISDGDRPEFVHVILTGWACRYKILKDGSRQITAFLLPGDFCDAHILLFDQMDHGISAVTNCKVALVSSEIMHELFSSGRISRALYWAGLVDEAILRAWIVNLGRRDAAERLIHLILELHTRLKIVGLAEDASFDLPLTQEDFADALGLTTVHVNRMLRILREDDLASHRAKHLVFADMAGMRKAVAFDDHYLHVRQRM